MSHDRYNPDNHLIHSTEVRVHIYFQIRNVFRCDKKLNSMNEQTIVNIHTPCVTLSYG